MRSNRGSDGGASEPVAVGIQVGAETGLTAENRRPARGACFVTVLEGAAGRTGLRQLRRSGRAQHGVGRGGTGACEGGQRDSDRAGARGRSGQKSQPRGGGADIELAYVHEFLYVCWGVDLRSTRERAAPTVVRAGSIVNSYGLDKTGENGHSVGYSPDAVTHRDAVAKFLRSTGRFRRRRHIVIGMHAMSEARTPLLLLDPPRAGRRKR